MDIKEIRAFSKRTKEDAEKILDENLIVDTLSDLGEVIIWGSYDLDLMWAPDIDIMVITKEPRDSSVKALNKFLENRSFQKYEYGDFAAFPIKNRPKSYIVNLRYILNGTRWEIETWFFKERPVEKINYFEEIKSKITPEYKDRILTMKQQVQERGISKKQVSSMKIYEAVLENEAKDISYFDN